MSDEVESFVSVRVPAWHSLGTVLEGHVSTAEMLAEGNLAGWNVRVEEVEVPDGYYSHKPQYRTVRTSPVDPNTNDILGYVGERYNPYQNEELFDFGDALLDGGRWETAGSLRSGTRVFGALELDRSTDIYGEDKINNYLLVSTSHDGTAAIQASVTPIRVVCMNTLNAALKGAKQTFKIRHTKSMSGKVAAAREALGLTNTYLDIWEDEMTKLVDQTVTDIQFEQLVNGLYAPAGFSDGTASKSGLTRFDKRKDVLWDIWTGDTITDIKNTGYGAYNTLNEELMWNRIGRGDNSLENVSASRAGFNPVWNTENNGLLAAVRGIAKTDLVVAV